MAEHVNDSGATMRPGIDFALEGFGASRRLRRADRADGRPSAGEPRIQWPVNDVDRWDDEIVVAEQGDAPSRLAS